MAEGYGRYYYQDSIRFCYIATGSLEETFSHLTLARELGYLSDSLSVTLFDEINGLRKMLHGYIAFLKNSKRGAGEPGSSLAVKESILDYQLNENSISPEDAAAKDIFSDHPIT